MKKSFILIFTAIASAFAVSCSKAAEGSGGENQQGEEQPVVINLGDVPEGYVRLVFDAEAEETKTAIADGEGNTHIVSWVAGDKVKVSYAGGSAETLAEGTGANKSVAPGANWSQLGGNPQKTCCAPGAVIE